MRRAAQAQMRRGTGARTCLHSSCLMMFAAGAGTVRGTAPSRANLTGRLPPAGLQAPQPARHASAAPQQPEPRGAGSGPLASQSHRPPAASWPAGAAAGAARVGCAAAA